MLRDVLKSSVAYQDYRLALFGASPSSRPTVS